MKIETQKNVEAAKAALDAFLSALAAEFELDDNSVEALKEHTLEGVALALVDSELASEDTKDSVGGFVAAL